MPSLIAIAVAGVGIAALAGCGGDSGGSATPAAPAARTASPSPAGTPGGDAARVDMRGYQYRPARVTVTAGETVTWTDHDQANHTVTFSGGPAGIANLRPGQSRSVTFRQPGSYAYVCQYHPNMHGTVVVR